MAITWEGNSLASLVEDTPAEIKFDRWGIAGGSLNWNILYENAAAAVASLIRHPDFPWLMRKSASVRREEAQHGRVTVEYEGVPPETSEKIYRCSGSTSTDPIETHVKFKTVIGASDELAPGATGPTSTGAVFDTDGKFKAFNKESDYAGVRSYLVGSLVYEESWLSGVVIGAGELSELGNKDNPPASNVKPTLGGSRDWLLITADIEQVGFGTRLQRKWRASGIGGWNDVIYHY